MGDNSFQSYLEALHGEFASLRTGAVASYIPELLKAAPDWFGIALVTVDGHVYQAGDSRQPFTIQSISKAITYGIALEDQGIAAVMRKVDVEPSGEAFNSISLEPGTGRPRNPMINAGAIATVALINGETSEDKFERMLACYERYLGRRVQLDDEVYHSEKSARRPISPRRQARISSSSPTPAATTGTTRSTGSSDSPTTAAMTIAVAAATGCSRAASSGLLVRSSTCLNQP